MTNRFARGRGGRGGRPAGGGGAPAAPRRIPRRRPVRRGQIISPFGVGAVNDFRNDEALMCAGLDRWFPNAPDIGLCISEERLQARLGCSHFVKPPDFGEGEGTSKVKIPHVRFPLWHYCPHCFRMEKTTLFGGQPQCDGCAPQGKTWKRRMIPVRIVAICEGGHIEDFPFQEWIGCSCTAADRKLFFKAGRSAASLAGIKISCTACDRTRSLAGAFEEGALTSVKTCSGAQPWLGREEGVHSCQHPLQTVQRGGSNVYFPIVTSSIYIPPSRLVESDVVRNILDMPAIWQQLSSASVNGTVPEAVCLMLAAVWPGVTAKELAEAATARLAGKQSVIGVDSEEDFRRQEYEVLCSGAGSAEDDLFVERADGSEYGWLDRFVRRVGLVRKLRETRVHVGFSRLMPLTDRSDPNVQPLSINSVDWLPAIEVRGEGIFVELREDAIDEWLADGKAAARVAKLISEYNRKRRERQLAPRLIDARFIMIQTLAHALIKELTFTCGYGSSSLRERLYCNLEDPQRRMNGFLVYTASGDSEGTLGGLVAQGAPKRFERLVHDALARASWCSNDPVCMESPDGGAFSSNLAACHSCVLLPEPSCEEGNRLLDRALLSGTVDDPDVGFFRDLPFRWAQ
ncbi:DrmB family protein [Salinarimonas chemoclinalis]|uniref:DrmB family protein n=1 Tax=Salinarimonas chemoclinalis TaxID=3241599 RepID=UPI0035562856